jgi:hypothetical protein
MFRAALKRFKDKPKRSRPVIEGMEPRILYSADGLSALLDPMQVDAPAVEAQPLTVPPILPDTQDQHAAQPAPTLPHVAPVPVQPITTELVVVDSRVADYQRLVDDIQARSGSAAWFEIVVLNQQDSGIQQITNLLTERHDVSAVHILSHGQDGGVQLGAGWVDGQTLTQQAELLAQWRTALTANADVLVYGCDVAEGTAGHAFIQELSRLTGADVAASSNVTGNAAFGGDWVLEEHVGFIDTPILLSGVARDTWFGTLATFTVNSLADTPTAGTLRTAITQANATPGLDNIVFTVSGTINVGSTLVITDAVDLNASSGGVPAIVLDGNNLAADGLQLTSTADGSTIRGFVIRDFAGDGIQIDLNSSNNVIAGNYIGSLNTAGTSAGAAESNSQGITVLGDHNTIGGTNALDRNVISGNSVRGIDITGAGADSNSVLGNFIGTDASGIAALANGGNGIAISNGASNNIIGGAAAGARNIVSGNSNIGIYIRDFDSISNKILGNYVGVDVTGNAPLSNGAFGVAIDFQATNTQIGGSAPGEGNVISGNTGSGGSLSRGGIYVVGESSIIQGNIIGLSANQASVIPNGGTPAIGGQSAGIHMAFAYGNTQIGGTLAGQGNVIAGNIGDGIGYANGNVAANVAILGNSIYRNTDFGIDLKADGLTANDPGDGDTGPNSLQNFPTLTFAQANASGTNGTYLAPSI